MNFALGLAFDWALGAIEQVATMLDDSNYYVEADEMRAVGNEIRKIRRSLNQTN